MDTGWFSEITLGCAKEPEARAKGSGPLACQSDRDVLEAAHSLPVAPIPFSKHCFPTSWVGLVSEGCTEGEKVLLEKKARRLPRGGDT